MACGASQIEQKKVNHVFSGKQLNGGTLMVADPVLD